MIEQQKILELVGVSYKNNTGRFLFDGIDFSLKTGQTAIIKGSTGTGKSSLVALLVGRQRAAAGSIYLFGKEVKFSDKGSLKRLRRKIGGVGGIYQPISFQTVYENVRHPLIQKGLKKKDQKDKILHGLTRFNLLNKKNDRAGNLSRGEKILLLLARAIVADQPLLLIDEPLAGLDGAIAQSVMKQLNRLSIAGHSMLILTSGQGGLDMPSAVMYELRNGKIV